MKKTSHTNISTEAQSYQLLGMADLVRFPESVLLLFRWTRVTRGLWERDCGMASTLHMRKTTTLMSPMRAKQLSMAAAKRVIWLCACVRYWPYRGVGTCAFSSPEPLGLICNRPVAKKRQTLGTRMVRVLQCLNWYCFKTHSAVHK